MPYLGLANIDDFLEENRPKYILTRWKDISMKLQEYYFASRLFGKAGAETMEGDHVEWRVQVENNDTFRFEGLFADAISSRQDLLTHAKMGWSMSSANYYYDINMPFFSTTAVKIIDEMRLLEHSMYNSYFEGMERAMFSGGPASPTQLEPPPCSLLWWLQPYNGNANQLSTSYITTALSAGSDNNSNFCGMDPPGFEAAGIGVGGINRSTYIGHRNRAGIYSVVSEDDAVDTIMECQRKCKFKPAHQYAELAPGSRPKWEILTTDSRVKRFNKILQSGNDNIRGDVATYKVGVPMVNGTPVQAVPAWSNQDFGTARTDGVILGVNWDTFKFYANAGRKMVRRPPYQDPHKPDVRWVFLKDSCQLVCEEARQNFILTCTETVTESN